MFLMGRRAEMSTAGLHKALSLSSALLHFLYFIFSALVSFSLCFPAPPSPFFLCSFSNLYQFSCSVVSDSETSWTTACQAFLSITNSQSLPKPMSIELVMPSNHLILCRPLHLLPPIPPSIKVFSNESTLRMRRPKF